MFNNNVVDFRTKDQKRADRMVRIKNNWNAFAGWVRDNKDVLIMVVPAGIAVIGGATKVASKALTAYTTNKEIRFKECTIYDHSLGRYVELRKPLTAAQSLTIEERRAAGEKLHMILDDMNLLKR